MILSRKTLLLNKSQNNIFLIGDPIPNVEVYPDGDIVNIQFCTTHLCFKPFTHMDYSTGTVLVKSNYTNFVTKLKL